MAGEGINFPLASYPDLVGGRVGPGLLSGAGLWLDGKSPAFPVVPLAFHESRDLPLSIRRSTACLRALRERGWPHAQALYDGASTLYLLVFPVVGESALFPDAGRFSLGIPHDAYAGALVNPDALSDLLSGLPGHPVLAQRYPTQGAPSETDGPLALLLRTQALASGSVEEVAEYLRRIASHAVSLTKGDLQGAYPFYGDDLVRAAEARLRPAAKAAEAPSAKRKAPTMAERMAGVARRIAQEPEPVFDLAEVLPSPLAYGDPEEGGGKFTARPGEVVMLFGDTGIGKSSLFRNVAVRLRRIADEKGAPPPPVLICTLEMTEEQEARCLLQITYGWGEEQAAMNLLAAAETGRVEKLTAPLDHIDFVTLETGAMTPKDVLLRAAAHPSGSPARLIVLDTLEAFEPVVPEGERWDDYKRFHQLCRQIKYLAERAHACVAVVHHINKAGQEAVSQGGTPDLHMSRGAKIASDLFDFSLAFGGARHTRERRLVVKKWRRSQTVDLRLEGDPRTMRYVPLTPFPVNP